MGSATLVSAASTSACLFAGSFSISTTRLGVSLIPSGPAERSFTGLGYHGNSAPSGSASTAPLALLLVTVPSCSMMWKEGIPFTPNMVESCSFFLRSEKGSASHGIDSWYSLKAASSRSDEQKMISNGLPASCSFLYSLASSGVNPRHGGHQWAEKYKPIVFPA